jgi:hypothetical protein
MTGKLEARSITGKGRQGGRSLHRCKDLGAPGDSLEIRGAAARKYAAETGCQLFAPSYKMELDLHPVNDSGL